MSYSPLPRDRNNTRFDRTIHQFFGRSKAIGIGTSYPIAGSEAVICKSDEVALIDELTVYSVSPDSAANAVITFKVNGIEFPFNIPGIAGALTRTDRLTWRTRGNLVVQPGQTLSAKANVAFGHHCMIRFRKKRLVDAIRDGDIKGGGSLPNVASTNTLTGSGTTAGTAKKIINGVSGQSIEILGLAFTGHNFNSAADNIRLGFWDGTTGNFGANGATIHRVWRMGANPIFAQPLLIGNTDGCIQGASGASVYIQATTNLAGATPTGDWVVLYRYIPASRICVASTTGTAGATPTCLEKFWVNTEAAVTASLTDAQLDRFFAATTQSLIVNVRGFGVSGTSIAADTFNAVLGIGLGAGPTVAATGYTGLGGYVPFSGDGGVPAAVSNTHFQDDAYLYTNLSSIPAFLAYQVGASNITNRSHLVWGRFQPGTLTGQDTVGQSQFGIFA